MNLTRAAVSIAALTLALAGCAPEADPAPSAVAPVKELPLTEPVEQDPAPVKEELAETPANDNVAVTTSVPTTCDALLDPNTVRSYDNRLVSSASGAGAEEKLASLLGPATMSTLQNGSQQIYCGWGINQTGAIAYAGVATIAEEHKATLIAALRDSIYEEIDANGADARFRQGMTGSHQYNDHIIFDGDLLIAASNTISGQWSQDIHATITG